MAVSWTTPGVVVHPRVRFGGSPGDLDREIPAITRVYTDAVTGVDVISHHALLTDLEPDSVYRYEVRHDRIAHVEGGTLRTAPADRARFTFTCFGDQGTSAAYDPLGTPASGHVVAGIERIDPLFTLVAGDLSYANQRSDPLQAWSDWFSMISTSARHRPWMPAAGNHEVERGNGPHGLAAYQSRFLLPDNSEPDNSEPNDGEPVDTRVAEGAIAAGTDPDVAGLWYAFTVSNVRFVILQNDDVCYQDAGMVYIRGYSGGRQRAWLTRTLRDARADPDIDWIIVCMHQTAVSSAEHHNGADLGIRQEWLPLFDAFEVDLVLCGHEHHYERTHPLRGAVDGSDVLTPRPVSHRTDVIDTSRGTVHMLLGTGGSSSPSAGNLFDPPAGRVIVGVEPRESDPRRLRSIYVREPAPWLALRAPDHPYAFAGFEVDPGEPGGTSRIHVTVYDSAGPSPVPFDTFTLVRTGAATTHDANANTVGNPTDTHGSGEAIPSWAC